MINYDITEMDAFESYAYVINRQHKEMWEARNSYIIEMYKILINNGFTRSAAVERIYKTLADKLNSLIEVRKTHIENITKEVKIKNGRNNRF